MRPIGSYSGFTQTFAPKLSIIERLTHSFNVFKHP